jgi:LmbE family N-acetylglucosaminyl deacetylase
VSGYRVLAIMAHPDDLEFSCGGTLAKWSDEGADLTVCIVTDGSTGTQDRDLMGPRLAEVRRQEAEAAAKVIGARDVVWMGRRDGYVEYTLDLRREFARLFRKYRPHRFMVMDPVSTIEDRFINHPDHRAVGQGSLDVTLSAGTTPGHFPELLEEGLEPWRGLREVWIAGAGAKPVVVDISTTIKRKIDALMCHRSQVGDDRAAVERWIRGRTETEGRRAGYPYGESFQVISEGPGFHAGEDLEDVNFPEPAPDPRA